MLKLKNILLEEVSPLQNKGMKYFYVLTRNVLKSISDQAVAAKVTPQTFMTFLLRECKLPPQIRTPTGNRLPLMLPPELHKIFPPLQSIIDIRFSAVDYAALAYSGGKITDLIIPIDRFLADFDSIKMSLQHEVQHLVSKGTSSDPDQSNTLVRNLDYLGNEGEVEAHAKQYAYLYFKAYPHDAKLDFQKFLSEIVPKLPDTQKNKITNYVNFGTKTKDLQTKYKVDDTVFHKMQLTYKMFIKNMQDFFHLFLQKTS